MRQSAVIYGSDIKVDDGEHGFWRYHASSINDVPRHQCNKRIPIAHWVLDNEPCVGCGMKFTDFNRLQFRLEGR
jgi:hypothetical protein